MTLRANELRIGNKIIGNMMYNGEVKTFERFNDDLSVVFFSDGRPSGIGEFLKDCYGVPLTEEWLLKFGFEKNKSGNYDNRMELALVDGYYHFRQGWTDVTISSVHQLQNLYFALTSKELPLANHPV